jgi:hypothetical protein
MNLSQPEHKAFLALPQKVREAAYQKVRARVGAGMVTVSEMLFVATEMI